MTRPEEGIPMVRLTELTEVIDDEVLLDIPLWKRQMLFHRAYEMGAFAVLRQARESKDTFERFQARAWASEYLLTHLRSYLGMVRGECAGGSRDDEIRREARIELATEILSSMDQGATLWQRPTAS